MKLQKIFTAVATALSAAALSLASTLSFAEIEVSTKTDGERTFARQVSATIIEIDNEERDITLEGPMGNLITLANERFANEHGHRRFSVRVKCLKTKLGTTKARQNRAATRPIHRANRLTNRHVVLNDPRGRLLLAPAPLR